MIKRQGDRQKEDRRHVFSNVLPFPSHHSVLDSTLAKLAWILTLRSHTIDSLGAVCQFSLSAHTKLIKLMDAASGSRQTPLKYNSFMNNSKH